MKCTLLYFTFSILLIIGTSNLVAQVYVDQITVTNTGTDGYTSCCGLNPTTDDFSASKRITSRALGVPQASDAATPIASYNFYSMGFGGEVIVRMGNGFNNIAGEDLQIHETSFGAISACSGLNPDMVRVWVSQDNCNYILIGDFCEQGPNPILISLPAYLPWARFVKLKDITTNFNTIATAGQDGFDLDGLKGLSARSTAPSSGSSIYGAAVISFTQGLNKNGSAVALSYSDPSRALGAPQLSDLAGAPVNYVSLGFGGSITLEMDRLVFKRATGGEIQIAETSTGSPSCASNPEQAKIYTSLNGTSWVTIGTICSDGQLSIPASSGLLTTTGQYAFRFIKITDVSNSASFSSSTANGFDLDGVVGQTCSTSAKLADSSEEFESEQIQLENEGIALFPNPSNGLFTIKTNSINANGVIRVYTTSGALIIEKRLTGIEENIQLSIQDFPVGLYLVSYQNGEKQFISRLIKN